MERLYSATRLYNNLVYTLSRTTDKGYSYLHTVEIAEALNDNLLLLVKTVKGIMFVNYFVEN